MRIYINLHLSFGWHVFLILLDLAMPRERTVSLRQIRLRRQRALRVLVRRRPLVSKKNRKIASKTVNGSIVERQFPFSENLGLSGCIWNAFYFRMYSVLCSFAFNGIPDWMNYRTRLNNFRGLKLIFNCLHWIYWIASLCRWNLGSTANDPGSKIIPRKKPRKQSL